jgi:hypothetical protein
MAYTLNRRLAQLVDGNGQLNTGKIPNDYITSDHVADNTITSAMLHTSFTVSTSNLTSIDTDDVSEGSTNLYFTDARADARIAAATTDDLTEGSTNLYYTDTRVGDYIYGNRTYGNVNSIGNISVAAGTGAKYLIVNSTSSRYTQIFGYGIRTSPGTGTYSIWPVANDSSSLDFGNFSSTLNWKNVRFHSTNGLSIGYTQFIDSSRNLTNIGTISSGAITSTGEVEATALDINGNGDISGNLTLGGYLAGPATFTIDPAAVGDNTGTVVIAGNLQVDGTTTTINSTTVNVDDLNIQLATGAANAAAADGAGITVDGASATITYDGTNDEWDFNKNINVTGTINSGAITSTGNLVLDALGHNYIELHSSTANTRKWRFYNGQAWNPDALLIYDQDADSTALTIETNKLGISRGANSLSHTLDVGGNVAISGTEIITSSGNLTNIGTISSGAILSTEADNNDIEVRSVGDYFPSLTIARTSGTTKTNYEWNLQIGSAGYLNFKDITNGYYPLIFRDNGDVYLGNNTSAASPVLLLDQSAASATFAANLTIQEYTGADAYTKVVKTNTGSNLAIVSQESIYLLLDENNDQTNRSFIIGANSGAPATADTLFRVAENGEVELKNNLLARNVGNLEVGSYNNGGTDYGLKLTPNDSSAHYHLYNDTGDLVFGASGTIGSGEKMRLASDGQLLINQLSSDVGASTNIVEADGNFRLQGGNRSIKFNNGSHEVVGLAQIASQKMQYASGRMTIDYGNSRVGIGTATYGVSPTHPLHVHMDVSNDTIDETKGLVKFQSTGGNGMIFGTIASSPYTSYIQSGYVVDTSAANYAISLNPLGGNVGIGVNDPDEKLEINGKTDYPYLKLSSTNNTSRYMRIGMANATDHVVEANGASTQLLFKTDGSTRLTIGATGGYNFHSNNLTNIGTIFSGGITASSGITATGPFKSGGSSNYLLLDYDGDFTGGNYYAIQDTSDNKLRISYGFSSTNCIDMDSSGNVTIPGGDLVVSGGVVSASNLKRNDQTSGSTVESSLWRSASSYVYDATNGLRYYWIRIAQIAPSNCRGVIEYETKTDENYPGFTKGTIAYSGFNGGASFSIKHDQSTSEGVPVVVRVDTSRQIWVQFSAAWASTSRWRISNYGATLTNVDTSWTVGSNYLDPNSTAVPPNSSGNIEPGQNLRATSSSVTGTIPSYDYYKQGNVRSDKQIVDSDVVYNGAVPLNFHYKGSDTYTKTVLYDGQNNTANNVFSGLTWEMGRLTNSDSATPRTFTISDRGGANRWCFSQYGLSFNPANSVATAAESLDDYEEGTWTVTDGSGAGLSFTVSNNKYTKVGRLVVASAQVQWPGTSNAAYAQLNVPFTSVASASEHGGVVTEQNYDTNNVVTASMNSTTAVWFRVNGGTALTNANLSGKKLRFTVIYHAA